ncbi:hypothetical protein V8C42DRAFT_243802 [Trichoderma barbatum]
MACIGSNIHCGINRRGIRDAVQGRKRSLIQTDGINSTARSVTDTKTAICLIFFIFLLSFYFWSKKNFGIGFVLCWIYFMLGLFYVELVYAGSGLPLFFSLFDSLFGTWLEALLGFKKRV